MSFTRSRLFRGDHAKGELDLAMIIVAAAADAVAVLAVAGAGTLAALIQRENRASGPGNRPDSESVDRAHRFDAEPARAPLIGKRAVDEAIGEHPLALFERRTDGFRRHDPRAPPRTARLRPRAPHRVSAPLSSNSRIFSAPSLPPGSRVIKDVHPARPQRLGERLEPASTCRPPPRLRG